MASKSIHISDAVHAQIQVVANAQGKTVDEAGEDILREALDFKQLLGEGHAHARDGDSSRPTFCHKLRNIAAKKLTAAGSAERDGRFKRLCFGPER